MADSDINMTDSEVNATDSELHMECVEEDLTPWQQQPDEEMEDTSKGSSKGERAVCRLCVTCFPRSSHSVCFGTQFSIATVSA
jgi:hypothetical protein